MAGKGVGGVRWVYGKCVGGWTNSKRDVTENGFVEECAYRRDRKGVICPQEVALLMQKMRAGRLNLYVWVRDENRRVRVGKDP